ncbi:Uncharacterized protein dnm_047020 [Desulfonema magnum]|uniref:Uncharacterized protein n=1 Tax=Desulfonema magnum TaxID=45655 RepID=A0A975BNE1_9BACT|nr:Uncharacterized protein dnm_047020 [Desulfonema magnum]
MITTQTPSGKSPAKANYGLIKIRSYDLILIHMPGFSPMLLI